MRQFSQAQESAIHHGAGPMLVLAGPGSGKTLTVTHRIRALIEEHHADPLRILVITFTKAAAEEMKERFRRITDVHYPVQFGTFHSFFYHILRKSYYPAGIGILSETQKRNYIQDILKQEEFIRADQRLEHAWTSDADLAELFLRELSQMRNSGQSSRSYQPIQCDRQLFIRILQAYERRKAAAGRIDFDDIQYHCFWLFYRNPSILQEWQERFTYLLIDEFQDICELQYRIIQMLAERHHNLFVVGDDDQSIYGFRGAKPDMMRRMLADYPDCRQVLLSENFRCSGAIVERAGRIICQSDDRIEKQITAVRERGESVRVLDFETLEQETDFLVQELEKLQQEGKLANTAIIVRTNRELSRLACCMAQAGLPFFMKEQAASIFRHFIAQDILAYLSFAHGNHSRQLFYRFMNKPYRGIPREAVLEKEISVTAMAERFEEQQESLFLCSNVRRLAGDLERLRLMRPFAAIQYLRKAMGYEAYVKQKQQKEHDEGEEQLLEILEQLQDSAREMDTFQEWREAIETYEKKLEQAMQRNEKEVKPENKGIQLMTMHGAKGLEYDSVYLPHLNEGILPHKKSMTQTLLNEECRMLYVGVTRARERLCMSYLTGTKEKPEQMSRFLKAILNP